MKKRGQQGFTLVELLVTISIGMIVALAATTVLLSGMRLNRHSTQTASRQNTTRILLSAMEEVATEGAVTQVVTGSHGWSVKGVDNTAFFSYDRASRTIYAGDTPMLEGVLESVLTLDSNNLLNIYVETEQGGYNSSVYCRLLPKAVAPETDKDEVEEIVGIDSATDDESRKKFLKILASQYRIKDEDGNVVSANPGFILNTETGESTGVYYSRWYIGDENWEKDGWNSQTPWCACYVTWGIHAARNYTNYIEPVGQIDPAASNYRPSFAGVDSFQAFFKDDAEDKNGWIEGRYWDKYAEAPKPGDIVFFDWIINLEKDPQHVGVVLAVTEEESEYYVYTIEGNSNNNMVSVQKYRLEDPRILGYGVLDWKYTEPSESTETE